MVRAIGNRESPSGRVLDLCDRRVAVPLVSRPVIAEYRETLNDPQVVRFFPTLHPAKVEAQIERLLYLGDRIRNMDVRFAFPRDPKDAKFIELAIVGAAAAIVTCDHDLLALSTGYDEVSKRFRRRLPLTHVVRPEVFLHWLNQPIVN
jgi:putative PIN family toxin of toxin-antitoxin system